MPNCQHLIMERSDLTIGRKSWLILKIFKNNKISVNEIQTFFLSLLGFKNMYQDDIDRRPFIETKKKSNTVSESECQSLQQLFIITYLSDGISGYSRKDHNYYL